MAKRRTMQSVRWILLLCVAAAAIASWTWLKAHPPHNPFAPLDIRDPIGMATATKLAALKSDVQQCRAALDRSHIDYSVLPSAGEGPCLRTDRTQLSAFPLAPDSPAVTCSVAVALELWLVKSVEPAAKEILGSEIARIEHLGAFNCRQMRGRETTGWSQHATANAIDISAFVLVDGRRITVLGGWDGDADEAQFLRAIRDDACGIFATVLSPNFNEAHADHFHFDQSERWSGVCR